MKRSPIVLLFLTLGAVAAGVVARRSFERDLPEPQTAAERIEVAPRRLPSEPDRSTFSRGPAQSPSSRRSAVIAEPSIIEVIGSARLSSKASLGLAVARLQREDPLSVAAELHSRFSDSLGKVVEREKLLWLARRVNSAACLPLWRDVLERHPPRVAEENLERTTYPEPLAAAASMEQMLAIEAIAELPGPESHELAYLAAHST